MTLPRLDVPVYEITLHSYPTPIKYRPFLVKEEKILLIALESQDKDSIVSAIKQILNNCLIEGDININKLPLFDVEYWFLNIRSKSVGEIVDLNLNCNDCEHINEYKLDINDVHLQISPDHTKVINLTDNVGVTMKYPTITVMNDFEAIQESTERLFDLVTNSIETVIEGETVHDLQLQSSSDINEFVLSLTQQQFSKLLDFYNTMPKLAHTINFACTKCDKKNTLVIQGVENFFT